MKKPAIKALALTMAITMAFSTPLTARASLADLYRSMTANSSNEKDSDKPDYEDESGNYEDESGNYEDESGNYEDESGNYEDESGNYEDESGNYEDDYPDKPGNGLDENYAARIIGLVLSEKNIEVDAGETANLSAAILLQATSTTGKTVQVAVNAANAYQYSNIDILSVDGDEDDATKALKSIEWKSANEGIAKVGETDKPGTISVQGIGLVDGNGTTEITASLLGKAATADVKVISYSKEMKLTAPDPVYLKHTYPLVGVGKDGKRCLNQISASGADYSANDAVTWELRAITVKNKTAKAATYAAISADGVMTAKKITAKGSTSVTEKQVTLEIRAVSERGVASNWAEVVILEGNPVKKISKITGDTKYDFGSTTSIPLTFEALYDTKNSGATTDDFTWTSAKTNIAEVISQDGATCEIMPKAVGSTKITVKATSGKSKSVTLKVTATILKELKGVVPESIVSGQSVKAVTDPVEYTGKFKYELDKSAPDDVKKGVTVKSNGAIVIKPAKAKELADDETITVPVKVTPTDKNYKKDSNFIKTFPVQVGKNPVVSIVISNANTLKNAKIYTNTDFNTYEPNDKGEIEYKDKVDYKAEALLYNAKKNGSIVTGLDDLISWKSSNTKVAEIDANGNITPIKSGSSTITASAFNSAGKVIKATVKIKVKTPATKIVINTPDVVKNPSDKKNQTVTLKASFPKGYGDKEDVIWTQVEGEKSGITIPGGTNKKASVKVTIAKGTKPGASAKFVVTATNGATATATVTVGAVVKEVKLATGGTPNIEQSKANAYTVVMKRKDVLDLAEVVSLVAGNASEQDYVCSPVYSLSGNKGNVILKNGKLYAIKEGKKIKLTIKAPAGKPSATLTITVNELNESTN